MYLTEASEEAPVEVLTDSIKYIVQVYQIFKQKANS